MSTSPPPTLSLHSCSGGFCKAIVYQRGAPPQPQPPALMPSHRPEGETLEGAVGFHRGAGQTAQPSTGQAFARQHSWSVQTKFLDPRPDSPSPPTTSCSF